MKHLSKHLSVTILMLLGITTAGMTLYSTAARATFIIHPAVIGTETSSGFVGDLFNLNEVGYTVASDGESPFDPFGYGHDTSDGIQLNNGFNWTQAADSNWVSLANSTWVLPAAIAGCGSENETTCEPVGHFVSSTIWNPGFTGTWRILDSNEGTSDVIITENTANGAELFFHSDPITGVPEPASLAILGAGLLALAGFGLRRRGGVTNTATLHKS